MGPYLFLCYSFRLVLKRFLRLLVALIGHTYTTPPITPPSWLYLVETVCQCVQLAGSPDYYDLPLLEASLECLLHLSSWYVHVCISSRPPL